MAPDNSKKVKRASAHNGNSKCNVSEIVVNDDSNRKVAVPQYLDIRVRPVIYQMLPRLFSNPCADPKPWGPITVNGSGKLNGITSDVLDSIKGLGVTHVWYTGIIEHAHDADYTRYGIPRHNPHIIKGRAGSPYAITDYYDVDPDLAENVTERIQEFEDLVERTHDAGLGVVIDFVPNHVGRQYASDAKPSDAPADFGVGDDTEMFFSPRNDFYYITRQQFSPESGVGEGSDDAYIEFPARASGNDCYTAFPSVNDWYETVKLNYGVDPWNGSTHFDPIPGVWHKMAHILQYWAKKNIDAFRCDMVHMVPVEFWRWVIPQVKAINPHLKFIAEIYDINLYGGYLWAGFDYLYDKVTLYDTLRAIQTSHGSAATLTSCWQTLEGKMPQMLSFLENHDEQRYASPQYSGDANTVLPSLVISATFSRGPVMIYMGQELGEAALESEGFSGKDGRTTIFDYWSIEKIRRWLNNGKADGQLTSQEQSLRQLYKCVLSSINRNEALQNGDFFDLMYANLQNKSFNPHRQYAYIRSGKKQVALIVVNFDNKDVEASVNIPAHALESLKLTPGTVEAVDLLSNKTTKMSIAPDAPVTVPLKKHGAVILVWRKNI